MDLIWILIPLTILLMCIFFWLIYKGLNFITKPNKKTDRRCTKCGRIIPIDAKNCPYCSKKF
jgi:hypothetical protein